MLTKQKIVSARWQLFINMPFPKGCVSIDPNGVCLASTDTITAGCISSYLSATLPNEKVILLERCHDDLERALEVDLPDRVRAYFSELYEIATLVLEDSSDT